MILDDLAQAEQYDGFGERIRKGMAFLHQPDLAELADGRHDIDGDRIYAMISHSQARPPAGAKLEMHCRYIDIHYLIAGREQMGWKPTRACRKPEAEYDESRDCQLFFDEPDAWLTLRPGQFIIAFPADAHLPQVGEGTLHKVVLKIAV